MIIKEIPIFENGTYNKKCELYDTISIGSVRCTGHDKIGIPKCIYCVSFKEEKTYYLKIMKEHTLIVSEVLCKRPVEQLKLF